MTDDRLTELLGRAFWRIVHMDEIEKELDRARQSEAEKDAQIKALGDVVERLWRNPSVRALFEGFQWRSTEELLRRIGRLP